MKEKSIKDKLFEGARRIGLELGERELRMFTTYMEELNRWSMRMNLVSFRSDDELIYRHILDSLVVTGLLKDTRRLLDIGSGAGLPGVPLKIVLPSIEVLLMDSVQKKVFFMRHVIRTLGLSGIEAVWARAEAGETMERFGHSFDCVISRAFSGLVDFVRVARPYLAEGGILLAIKGPLEGRLRGELEGLKAWDHGPPEIHTFTLPPDSRPSTVVVFRS